MMPTWLSLIVVVAGVKLKILKANHNPEVWKNLEVLVVVAGVKLKILKANHNDVNIVDPSEKLLLLV